MLNLDVPPLRTRIFNMGIKEPTRLCPWRRAGKRQLCRLAKRPLDCRQGLAQLVERRQSEYRTRGRPRPCDAFPILFESAERIVSDTVARAQHCLLLNLPGHTHPGSPIAPIRGWPPRPAVRRQLNIASVWNARECSVASNTR